MTSWKGKLISSRPALLARTLALLGALLSALIWSACDSAPEKEPLLPPPEFPSIMQTLRRESRDLERALLRDDRELLLRSASRLADTAGLLPSIPGPPDFHDRGLDLLKRNHALIEALDRKESVQRIELLFGETMEGCIACHRAWRRDDEP